jgi:2-polyprenyl-3-methyl-5-hydroxy-6-metoxy-1,4-benzoquinol methylase
MSQQNLDFSTLLSKPNEFQEAVASLSTNELYAHTLTAQTKLYWPSTQDFLEKSAEWKTSHDILDAGCGPGEVLFRLINKFPEKNYFGVDLESEFIARAKKTLKATAVELRTADIFQFKEKKFDAILLWAVLQHLGEPIVAVTRLAELLRPNGRAFFYDANGKTEIHASPSLPLLTAMYTQLKEKGKGKRDADCLTTVQSRIGETPFKIVQVLDSPVSLGQNQSEIYVCFSYFVSELTKRFYALQSDQSALLDELLTWYRSPQRSVTTDNASWLVLQKK